MVLWLSSLLPLYNTVYSFLSLFSSSFQTTTTTTTVIAAQPTTTYVPVQRRNNESIPTIGLVITIVHLIACLSFGNIAIFACLAPALICAIVVSLDLVHMSENGGGGEGEGHILLQ